MNIAFKPKSGIIIDLTGKQGTTWNFFTAPLDPYTNEPQDYTGSTARGLILKTAISAETIKTLTCTVPTTSTGAISITVSSTGYTFTRASGSFITDGFAVGDPIGTNSTQALNRKLFSIIALSALVMTVEAVSSTGAFITPTLTAETATMTIKKIGIHVFLSATDSNIPCGKTVTDAASKYAYAIDTVTGTVVLRIQEGDLFIDAGRTA